MYLLANQLLSHSNILEQTNELRFVVGIVKRDGSSAVEPVAQIHDGERGHAVTFTVSVHFRSDRYAIGGRGAKARVPNHCDECGVVCVCITIIR